MLMQFTRGRICCGADIPNACRLHTLQANFVEKLKGDFENLSIAIADLPVGLIPFPDR